ncbi:hypothetical protein [Rhodopirellula baltica]|uniref:hypothetical protein n=1 Tax=Rhodopirellula baltica TaxID=265606 RepID=UPI0005641EF8|nr:hypothetical protein [Rhodopirellula baltica]
MAERIECLTCNTHISQDTATNAGGQCLICRLDRRARKPPVIVVRSGEIGFAMPAPAFQKTLKKTKPTGGTKHPNYLELEAQKALVAHALHHKINFVIHDDLWGRTTMAATKLLEQGVGQLLTPDYEYEYSQIRREEWVEGTEPLMQRGGFSYLNDAGVELYRRWTWMS